MITGLLFGVAQAIYIQCDVNQFWAGQYDWTLKTLKICENFPGREIIETHEFGHRLWFERLTTREKQKFKAIESREKDCVTPYACISTEENFAENARVVLMGGKVDTDKKAFVRAMLRKYEISYGKNK